jgi:hypothetical protein
VALRLPWDHLLARWLGEARPMRHSVVRRSLYTGAFFIAGHAFYYLLVLVANGRLDRVGFGRFYLGWAILNVLVAPGGVLALSLSGYFAEVHRAHGAPSVLMALRRTAWKLLPWILLLVAVIEALLLLSGKVFGADSALMIVLLPLTALASVMVDAVRAVFQGMLRFVWFGASWLVWCIVQFALGAAGLVVIGAPWAVFLGMLTANALTLTGLVAMVRRMGAGAGGNESGPGTMPEPVLPSLAHALPFCTALGGFVLLSNADVLVAYLKLAGTELGAYAASAVLPKAIVTATQPVAQVVLPVATAIRGESLSTREALRKAVGLTFALAALGAAALWILSGEACGGRFGIQFCDPTLLLLLAAASVAVSVIRISMIAEILSGRTLRAHFPIVAFAVFALASWFVSSDGTRLAVSYLVLCWMLLGILALVHGLGSGRAAGGRPDPVPQE